MVSFFFQSFFMVNFMKLSYIVLLCSFFAYILHMIYMFWFTELVDESSATYIFLYL